MIAGLIVRLCFIFDGKRRLRRRALNQRNQLAHIPAAVVGIKRHAVKQNILARFGNGDAKRAGRQDGILGNAVQAVRRRSAGDTLVHGGAQGVNIRPCSLVARAAVLLEGRVAVLEQNGHGFLFAAVEEPRRAEIHQSERAVLGEHDVVGRNISVNNALRVHFFKNPHNRQHQPENFVISEDAFFAEVRRKGVALNIFHYDVGGIVFRKIVMNRNNARLGREPC